VSEVHVLRASPEPSLSDHNKHTLFNLVGEQEDRVKYRNSRTTYWATYREELQADVCGFFGHFSTVKDIQIAADFLQQAVVSSYENNCPLRTAGCKREFPWWSLQLARLCWDTRKILNEAKRSAF
jgi:hypothetical protein